MPVSLLTLDKTLPRARFDRSVRGHQAYRVITHFHTAYSYDACDGNGRLGTAHNTNRCLQALNEAVCLNRLDYLFVSDHVNHMADVPFEELLLTKDPSRFVHDRVGRAVAARANCTGIIEEDGFERTIVPGLEGRLLALGLTHHISSDWKERQDVYLHDRLATATRLKREVNAIIITAHTESKTQETIESYQPDGIEIYNFHANFDPNIRRQWLHEPPFSHLKVFVDYLLDSYRVMNPDMMFIEFFKQHPVYFDRWNRGTAHGFKWVGVGATDAHENVFKQKVTDHERLDSYRRLTRFMSNWVWSPASDYESVKEALRNRQSYWVLEGLGTPTDFDFHAVKGNTFTEVGAEVVKPDSIRFKIPALRISHPDDVIKDQPIIRAELHKIDAQANETIVASAAAGSDLVLLNPAPGAYRVHVFIEPTHLRKLIQKGDFINHEYPWMISNHIYVKAGR